MAVHIDRNCTVKTPERYLCKTISLKTLEHNANGSLNDTQEVVLRTVWQIDYGAKPPPSIPSKVSAN